MKSTPAPQPKSKAVLALETIIRRVIRQEMENLRTQIVNELLESLQSVGVQQLNESSDFRSMVEAPRPQPTFAKNGLLNELLGDSYLRSGGGNEYIPTEADHRSQQVVINRPNQGNRQLLRNDQALSLEEAIPVYDAAEGTGDGVGSGGLRVADPLSVIKANPVLERALTRNYSDLMKAMKKKGK